MVEVNGLNPTAVTTAPRTSKRRERLSILRMPIPALPVFGDRSRRRGGKFRVGTEVGRFAFPVVLTVDPDFTGGKLRGASLGMEGSFGSSVVVDFLGRERGRGGRGAVGDMRGGCDLGTAGMGSPGAGVSATAALMKRSL